MKVYLVEDQKGSILGIYYNYKKAYINCICFNFCEEFEGYHKISKDVKTFINIILDEENLDTYYDLKDRLSSYSDEKVKEFYEFIIKVKTEEKENKDKIFKIFEVDETYLFL
jgi:hypothetical protein